MHKRLKPTKIVQIDYDVIDGQSDHRLMIIITIIPDRNIELSRMQFNLLLWRPTRQREGISFSIIV